MEVMARLPAPLLRLSASYLSVEECLTLRGLSGAEAIRSSVGERDWLTMLGTATWRIIADSWPHTLVDAMQSWMGNDGGGACITGSTVVNAFYFPSSSSTVAWSKPGETVTKSVGVNAVMDAMCESHKRAKDVDVVVPLTEEGWNDFLRFYGQIRPHVWNAWITPHQKVSQNSSLIPLIRTILAWRPEVTGVKPFVLKDIGYTKHVDNLCIRLFLTDRTGNGCVCQNGCLHRGPCSGCHNNFRNCPSVHRQMDVIFVPLFASVETTVDQALAPRIGQKRCHPSDPSTMEVNLKPSEVREGVWRWVAKNFDFDICANVVFGAVNPKDSTQTAPTARCLAPQNLLNRAALFRDDQYCVRLNLENYRLAWNREVAYLAGSAMPASENGVVNDRILIPMACRVGWDWKFGSGRVGRFGPLVAQPHPKHTRRCQSCPTIVCMRIDKYTDRGFKIQIADDDDPQSDHTDTRLTKHPKLNDLTQASDSR